MSQLKTYILSSNVDLDSFKMIFRNIIFASHENLSNVFYHYIDTDGNACCNQLASISDIRDYLEMQSEEYIFEKIERDGFICLIYNRLSVNEYSVMINYDKIEKNIEMTLLTLSHFPDVQIDNIVNRFAAITTQGN